MARRNGVDMVNGDKGSVPLPESWSINQAIVRISANVTDHFKFSVTGADGEKGRGQRAGVKSWLRLGNVANSSG